MIYTVIGIALLLFIPVIHIIEKSVKENPSLKWKYRTYLGKVIALTSLIVILSVYGLFIVESNFIPFLVSFAWAVLILTISIIIRKRL